MAEIDHEYTDELVCPHCGNEAGDSWEVNSDEEELGLLECDECGKHFYGTRNITVNYCTKKAEYGTCNGCQSENVVVENYSSSIGEYAGLCIDCGRLEKRSLEMKYYESLEKKIYGRDNHA